LKGEIEPINIEKMKLEKENYTKRSKIKNNN
jgi:hypothetical protein